MTLKPSKKPRGRRCSEPERACWSNCWKNPRTPAKRRCARAAQRCAAQGPRPKRLVSLLGSVSLRRLYYHCRHCWRGTAPFDSALDIAGTQYSPGVRRLLAVVGGETPFARGRELLAELAGIAVSVKAVERQAEAIGSDLAARAESARLQAALRGFPPTAASRFPPSTSRWTAPASGHGHGRGRARGQGRRHGAHPRGQAWAASSRRPHWTAEGRPVRDQHSTTYTGAIEDAEAFGRRIYDEAWRRGLHRGRARGGARRRSRLDLEFMPSLLPQSHRDRRHPTTPASICGNWAASCSRKTASSAAAGCADARSNSTRGASSTWCGSCAVSGPTRPK